MPRASDSALPAILDHSMEQYEVIDEIARGGMGVIYRVRDKRLGRVLAMKVMSEVGKTHGHESCRRALARFVEEARVTAQLDHPGIVSIHEFGIDPEGRPCFTMKLVKGSDLNTIFDLVREGREGWSLTRAVGVLVKVCQAMGYAHSKWVIHRDLKPSNIMVGRFGEVYVMDWGLSKVVGQPDAHPHASPSEVPNPASLPSVHLGASVHCLGSAPETRDGAIMGTPSYMSPEQARGEIDQIDAASDIYSLGAILYTLLAGQAPHVEQGSSVAPRVVLARVLEGPPRRIHHFNPRVPPELIAICEKAMARAKTSRYTSSIALAEDLQAYLEDRVVRAYRTGPAAELVSWLLRNRRLAIVGGTALGMAVAGLIIFTWERGRATERLQQSIYAADMKLAHDALKAGNRGQASRLVEKYVSFVGRSDPRGFEWRRLWKRCQSREEFTLEGSVGRVLALAFSADGKTLYSGGTSGDILEWDIGKRALSRRVAQAQFSSFNLAATPDGRALVASTPRGVQVWHGPNLNTNILLPDAADPIGLSPDGRMLATGGKEGLMIWDSATWGLLGSLAAFPNQLASGKDSGLTQLAFSPDGSMLAAAVRTPSEAWINVYETAALLPDAVDATQHRTFHLVGSRLHWWGVVLAFSADGTLLVSGTTTLKNTLIQVWAVNDGRLLAEGHHESVVTAMAFSDDNRRILMTSFANDPSVWDFTPGSPLVEAYNVPRHRSEIWSLAVGPKRSMYATGCKDGSIKVWRPSALFTPPSELSQLESTNLVACGFVSGGLNVAALERDGGVKCWDLKTLSPVATPAFLKDAKSAAIAPDGSWAVVQRTNGAYQLGSVLDVEGAMPPAPIELLPAEARTNHPVVAWGPGGRHVAIATDEVSVWEVRSKKRLSRFSLPQPHGVIALSGDARWFATRNLGGAPTLALWDVRAGKVHAIWKCSLETLNNLQFSPDGSLLAAGNMDNSVILWEVPDGKVRTILNGHTLAVWALAFSSDARTLVTRGSDGLRLWNTATAQEIASLDIRGADGFALAPDDRALVVLRENRLMVDIVPLATEITGAKR